MGKNIPNDHSLYQTAISTYLMPNGHKILQIIIKYKNIFHSKVLQNLPKLGFLVWKQTVWQPCYKHMIGKRCTLPCGLLWRQGDQIGRIFAYKLGYRLLKNYVKVTFCHNADLLLPGIYFATKNLQLAGASIHTFFLGGGRVSDPLSLSSSSTLHLFFLGPPPC
jgi:hypothetical protein